MRKYIYYLGILATSLFMDSCTDSFIESAPTTQVPGDTYNENTIGASMIGAYLPLQWFDLWMPLPLIHELMGDDICVGGTQDSELHEISRYQATAIRQPDAIWSASYAGVFRTNVVIKYAPTVDMSDQKKASLVAEAYALRTFYYYQLWCLYGNIPFFENNPTDILTQWKDITQFSKDEIYTKLIRDIDKALEGKALPLTAKDGDYGRFTRSAALMLKAHIVLMQEDATKYPEVLTGMEEIIKTHGYSLMDNYGAIWEETGEWCSESIFEINYSAVGASRGWGSDNRKPGGTVFPKFIGINGLEKDNNFDNGWGYMTVMPHLYNLFDDADQRKNTSILSYAYYKANVNPLATYDHTRWDDTGYFNKKYLPRKGASQPALGSNDLNFPNNLRVYRLSDTYLIASELLVRTSGSQITADKYLNEVRGRAYNYTGSYQRTATLDNILAERRLEFSGEGYRFFDLIRFGKANTITKSVQIGWTTDASGNLVQTYGTFSYSPASRYFPIPLQEIDKSQGAIKQNTGY